MRFFIIHIIFLVISTKLLSQINCDSFKYSGDLKQFEACEVSENARFYNQFSKEFQDIYDKSLVICPYFAYAYKQKSIAYLKSGDFITWKFLMDNAVKYDELDNLGYRGWSKFQFFRDYEGAILDIERLENITDEVGFSQNGNYYLTVVKAMSYSAIGNNEKAIEIIENLLDNDNYSVGSYDYYQLGVFYFNIKDYENALVNFKKQADKNQLAENVYYIAQIDKLSGREEDYKKNKQLAIDLYKNKQILFDPYTHHYNKVFLKEIELN